MPVPKHVIDQDYGVLKAGEGLPFSGCFIIDDKDILPEITKSNLPAGYFVHEMQRLVQAFQLPDTQDEGCQVGCKSDHDNIKLEVKKSKEYFSKQK